MFKWRNIKKHFHGYDRRHGSNDSRRWLTISLLFIFILFTSLDPITTFSRYVVNRSYIFDLTTSDFFFTSSLEENVLTLDDDTGFTPVNTLTVSNYEDEGNNINIDEISYTITLEENDPNPIFDLYTGEYIDEVEVKTICEGNTIDGILDGTPISGSSNTNNHALYLKLKDPETTLEASHTITIKVTSSEPYIRSYNFNVIIKAATTDMITIPDTDIERPNVPIPDEEIMVFKEGEYVYLTPDQLVSDQVVIDDVVVNDMNRPNLAGGSLYIPESVGELAVGSDETINWDVQGHIIMEPNIAINNENISVTMLSHEGDVIMNGITMTGGSANPYVVNITAKDGSIEANGTEITSKADGNGKINLEARNYININDAQLESGGDYGINIQSTTGINAEGATIESTNGADGAAIILQSTGLINLDGATVKSSSCGTDTPTPALLIESTGMGISAQNATIESTNGAAGAAIILQSTGLINLDQATVTSKVDLSISAIEGISAQSANITNSQWGKNIKITSSNATIDLSSLTGASQTLVSSSGGSIYITAQEDVFIIAANIKASTSWDMELKLVGTDSTRSTLWVENAIVQGYSINADNFIENGTPASGTIIYNP